VGLWPRRLAAMVFQLRRKGRIEISGQNVQIEAVVQDWCRCAFGQSIIAPSSQGPECNGAEILGRNVEIDGRLCTIRCAIRQNDLDSSSEESSSHKDIHNKKDQDL
jgi:hypothetical protein